MEASFFEPLWYVVYTNANHEKRVTHQLESRSVEHFLPLYQSGRRWKDRRVRLHMPLFPGYVFVKLALRDQLQILQIPDVVRLVSFNGHPTSLPQEDIEAIRNCLDRGHQVEPHPYLRARASGASHEWTFARAGRNYPAKKEQDALCPVVRTHPAVGGSGD